MRDIFQRLKSRKLSEVFVKYDVKPLNYCHLCKILKTTEVVSTQSITVEGGFIWRTNVYHSLQGVIISSTYV